MSHATTNRSRSSGHYEKQSSREDLSHLTRARAAFAARRNTSSRSLAHQRNDRILASGHQLSINDHYHAAIGHNSTRLLALTGLFGALITLMTAFIAHIPIGLNGGYIHFGDGLVFLAAAVLPTPYAMAAAAIGGGLADLMTAPVWAPATILIKVLITLPFTSRKGTLVNTRNICAAVFAIFLTCIGYFVAELLIFGIGKAGMTTALITSVGGNLIQGAGSFAFFIVIGLFLDRARIIPALSNK